MVESKNCCGCSACYSACPKGCISMISDSMGFLYPSIDEENCIHCKRCEDVCPVLHSIKSEVPYAWAGKSKDQEIRNASSSGGVFSLLAKYVIKKQGVVVGAALSEDCKTVNHIIINTEKELSLLRGSKYVQSNMNNIFNTVKSALKAGKLVLFSGTPCQIDGLNLFLGKEYDNLITVEIICHGTPSPKLYEKYIEFIELKFKSTVRRVFFRDEKIGGGGYADNEN